MATHRTHIAIDRPADEVWSVVSDAGNISAWFPVVQTSEATSGERHEDGVRGLKDYCETH